jgi:RNA polymerase sigma factor (TIGR02999 family)
MSDVTGILSAIELGDPSAAEQLLPLVYEELRKLAGHKLAQERPGQTLTATDLVHEAYLRLVDVARAQHWNSRGHFFGAAAEAMRRILIDAARRRQAAKHGGERNRVALDDFQVALDMPDDLLLALDEALHRLAERDPRMARLVEIHCFAGQPIEQVAQTLGISARTAYRDWSFARAWLFREIRGADTPPPS